jgi:hypothetical protein
MLDLDSRLRSYIRLYLRFTLSSRDVEDLLAERWIVVSYETVRRWVNHFGPMIAAHLTISLGWAAGARPRATGRTEERAPWAPWIKTPSISAVADGPVWKAAQLLFRNSGRR